MSPQLTCLEPFRRSFEILLSCILQNAGASACLLYELEDSCPTLILRGCEGVPAGGELTQRVILSRGAVVRLSRRVSPVWVDLTAIDAVSADETLAGLAPFQSVYSLPLRSSGKFLGLLHTAFEIPTPPSSADARLIAGIAGSLSELIAFSRRARSMADLVAEVAGLSIELADSKIADRAAGVANAPAGETAEVIASHVARVIEGGIRFEDQIRETLNNLREQRDRRELLHRAKGKLQKEAGLSEEQAYLTLQRMSRSSSSPLLMVAERVLCGDTRSAVDAAKWLRS